MKLFYQKYRLDIVFDLCYNPVNRTKRKKNDMPRDPGPARNLKHSARTLLDDEGLKRLNECSAKFRVRPAEILRRALDLFYITNCSPNSIDSTIQSVAREHGQ